MKEITPMGRTRRVAAILTVGAGALVVLASSRAPDEPLPGGDAPARIVLDQPGERGEPLLVEGRVFRPDGRTPAPGVVLYVYQTDATGHYARLPGLPPRLRGWMKTDGQGRYQYRTIRPAPYPGERIPAHVHTQLWGGGWPAQWNEDLLFADDPSLGTEERRRSAGLGSFAFVCEPRRVEGVLRCTHDLRLKPQGDRFEDNIRHGFRKP